MKNGIEFQPQGKTALVPLLVFVDSRARRDLEVDIVTDVAMGSSGIGRSESLDITVPTNSLVRGPVLAPTGQGKVSPLRRGWACAKLRRFIGRGIKHLRRGRLPDRIELVF